MAELLSYRFHEEIDFIMEGPVGRLHSMADEVAALEQQNASLQQRVEALEQVRKAASTLRRYYPEAHSDLMELDRALAAAHEGEGRTDE